MMSILLTHDFVLAGPLHRILTDHEQQWDRQDSGVPFSVWEDMRVICCSMLPRQPEGEQTWQKLVEESLKYTKPYEPYKHILQVSARHCSCRSYCNNLGQTMSMLMQQHMQLRHIMLPLPKEI